MKVTKRVTNAKNAAPETGPLSLYPAKVLAPGRVAQRESTRFTREGSLVRSQPRP